MTQKEKEIEWVKRMADLEDGCCVSVGGWICDILRTRKCDWCGKSMTIHNATPLGDSKIVHEGCLALMELANYYAETDRE